MKFRRNVFQFGKHFYGFTTGRLYLFCISLHLPCIACWLTQLFTFLKRCKDICPSRWVCDVPFIWSLIASNIWEDLTLPFEMPLSIHSFKTLTYWPWVHPFLGLLGRNDKVAFIAPSFLEQNATLPPETCFHWAVPDIVKKGNQTEAWPILCKSSNA
jgi:hypothetical protein